MEDRRNTMRLVCMNLRHLYQQRVMALALILVLFGLGLMLSMVFFDNEPVDLGRGVFLLPSILMGGLGLIMGVLVADVWARPFAFCLPGHQEVSLRLLYGAGVFWPLAGSVALLWFPRHVHPGLFPVAYLSVNLLAFWIGTAIVLSLNKLSIFSGFICPISIVVLVSLKVHTALERAMLDPYGAILISGVCWLATFGIVLRLGARQSVRAFCAGPWLSFVDLYSPQKVQALARQRQVDQQEIRSLRLEEPVNQWFCTQIARDGLGLGRYTWSVLYQTVGRLIVGWKVCVILGIIETLILGYMSESITFFVMINFLMFIGPIRPMTEELLKTEGRWQRFAGACALTLVLSGLVALNLCGVYLITHALDGIMPPLTIKNYPAASFHGLDPLVFILPLVLIPLSCGVSLLAQRTRGFFWWAIIVMPSLMLLLQFWGFFIASPDIWLYQSRGRLDFLLAGLIASPILSWLVFLACSAWHCFKRDLNL